MYFTSLSVLQALAQLYAAEAQQGILWLGQRCLESSGAACSGALARATRDLPRLEARECGQDAQYASVAKGLQRSGSGLEAPS